MQVKDLRAIRDLLDHHMDDLDDVFTMLREHGVDGAHDAIGVTNASGCKCITAYWARDDWGCSSQTTWR